MPYDGDQYNEAKRLYVKRWYTPEEIHNLLGEPSIATLYRWASDPDSAGVTWKDLRKEEREQRYEETGPKAIAAKIIARIDEILSKETFDNKDADALAKLQSHLEKVTDARYQIPVMYDVLTDLLIFLKDHYQEQLTPALLSAVRRFKNELRERLEA